MGTPVYKTITDDLLKAIDSGRLRPGDRIASIRELCDQYNVSQITVLRVFKELVQADRIVRHEGTGYFVKDAEKMDRSGNTLILACRSPRAISEHDNFILRLSEGIHTHALEKGFNLFVPKTVATVRGHEIDDAHMENLLRDIQEVPHPAGIIFDMLYPDVMIEKHILPKIGKLPCVIAGRPSRLPIRTVSLPFEKAADDAAMLAVKSGAKEFFIYEQGSNPWGGNRILCSRLREQLIRNGIPSKMIHCREKILMSPQRDSELIAELGEKILGSTQKTLVFSSSDYFTKVIMDRLHESCRFGSRASLMTFGGFEFIRKYDPPVTSLVPDARRIGVLAVEQILKNDMAAYSADLMTDYKIELNGTL